MTEKGDGKYGKNELMTPAQAAAYCATTVPTLATWRCTGKVPIPYVKIGASVRYRRKDLDNFITSCLHGEVADYE